MQSKQRNSSNSISSSMYRKSEKSVRKEASGKSPPHYHGHRLLISLGPALFVILLCCVVLSFRPVYCNSVLVTLSKTRYIGKFNNID